MSFADRVLRAYQNDSFSLAGQAWKYVRKRGFRSVVTLPGINRHCFRASVNRLHARQEVEDDFEDVLETAYTFNGKGLYRSIRPMQGRQELSALVTSLEAINPERVMELGTCRGGTFYVLARQLDTATHLISLDRGYGGKPFYRRQIRFMKHFAPGKRLDFLIGNSHRQKTLARVQDALAGEKLDALFIDGDHSYAGVKQDFEMYRPLVRDGGVIAFDDIHHPKYGVERFWEEVTDAFETEEFNLDANSCGIGILHV